MTYNPAELTPVDVIRRMAGDTSNDPTDEILQDSTYAAILGRFGVGVTAGSEIDTAPFYRAAAEILRSVAVAIEGKPTSISTPKDGAMGWTSRTQSLRDQAKALDLKADALEGAAQSDSFFGPVVTVRSRFLTGSRDGGDEW